MNADDRVMTMLAKANPRPSDEPIPSPVPASAYLATLEKRSSEMTKLDTRTDEARRPTPRLRMLAAAVAIVIIAGVALILQTRVNEDPTPATDPLVTPTTADVTPTSEAQALDPQLEDALAVTAAFMRASAIGDVPTMHSLALLDGHTQHLLGLGSIEIPNEIAWREAVGWNSSFNDCELTNPDVENTTVVCSTTNTNALSDALGVGPYWSRQHFTVLYEGDTKIDEVMESTTIALGLTVEFPASTFSAETGDPFFAWLEARHPEDISTMLSFDWVVEFPPNILFGGGQPRLTDESIDLWQQHVVEFVTEQSG